MRALAELFVSRAEIVTLSGKQWVKRTCSLQSFPTTKGEFLHIEFQRPDDLDKGHELQRVYFRCQGNDTSRGTYLYDVHSWRKKAKKRNISRLLYVIYCEKRGS